MKVVLFTSVSLRHLAFAKRFCMSSNISVEYIFYENPKENNSKIINIISNKQKDHFYERSQSEKDIFNWFLNLDEYTYPNCDYVNYGWFSSDDCLNKLKKISPDLILVYGTSILKGQIISRYRKRIINLHLGLSPYYRGAGTNYFPFVNNEPEYCGGTFMFLDEGIDTGEVIHQIRPKILQHDSFHQLSNRFLIEVFDKYVALIENFKKIKMLEQIDQNKDNFLEKVYKKKDFTDTSLEKLHFNFKNNIIGNYLLNKLEIDKSVEILTQEFL